MDRNIMLNKSSIIEGYISRINEVYDNEIQNLSDYTKQDSIILNIQRACEASIDLAMHIVSENKLGIPQTSREVFDLLFQGDVIDEDIAEKLKAMVGFRNIAVHDYQNVNLEIVRNIIEKHLDDLKGFVSVVIKL